MKRLIDFEQKSERKQAGILIVLLFLESVLVTLTMLFFRYYRSYSGWSRASYAKPYQIRFAVLLPVTVLLGLYFAHCLSGFLKKHSFRERIRPVRIDRIRTEFPALALLLSGLVWADLLLVLTWDRGG